MININEKQDVIPGISIGNVTIKKDLILEAPRLLATSSCSLPTINITFVISRVAYGIQGIVFIKTTPIIVFVMFSLMNKICIPIVIDARGSISGLVNSSKNKDLPLKTPKDNALEAGTQSIMVKMLTRMLQYILCNVMFRECREKISLKALRVKLLGIKLG